MKIAVRMIGLVFLMSVYSGLAFDAAAGQKTHTVFFQGRKNELHVFRINGTIPGKTLLIVGGIQGDEPGGYLAADFFVDYSLEKGSLIVVPRANFPSILKNERKINQDMNRTFQENQATNYETEVAQVLKRLICESDCFLNLHEGSGIFSPHWISETQNPSKYGQSIIADDAFLQSKNGERIDLEKMAGRVIREINARIKDEAHHFHFNNHRTSKPDSLHKEQRRSATYYAMNDCKIPAFGIESAKRLPLETKIKQHIYAINGFMEVFDIVPETPGVTLEQPEMQYMILSINDSIPVVVSKMQRLSINRGDTVEVHDIVANYERGLSADILGVGNEFNDMKKKYIIREPTRIVAKKDFYSCGSVFLDFAASRPAVSLMPKISSGSKETSGPGIRYKLKVNGEQLIVENYGHVKLVRGDKLVIVDILAGDIDPSRYVVNLKGFVGNRRNNNGEDRGYLIDTGKKVLMKRYSIHKMGRRYFVVTTLDGKEVGKMFINIES